MVPRPEHPKPQFERSFWKNLNGTWQFEIDNSKSGQDRGLTKPDAVLSGIIKVPFCPQSRLSGLAHIDFIFGVWYRRSVSLSEEECDGHVFLHFGAVDYECDVYVNGIHAGYHKGGFVSFRFDVTKLVHPGENIITVNARDDEKNPMIPSGKQSGSYHSHGCYYTRTIGIWQTVWLEFTPRDYIKDIKYDTNAETGTLVVTAHLEGKACLSVEAFYEGKPMGSVSVRDAAGEVVLAVNLAEIHLWEPGAGRLYDLILRYGEDTVRSYFGLRSMRMDGHRFLINGKSVFQRLILDQGFYPDGIYTAPSDDALSHDIDISMDMGFNGARLHQKVFEERYLYHCDKKGYLVWGEYPSWGLDHSYPEAIYSILPEWLEVIRRDRNHPSIIGWCPFNETWDKENRCQYDDLLRLVYRTTKALDPSRPCIDTSGNFHVETDIYDVHNYNQDPVSFKEQYDRLMNTGTLYEIFDPPQSYRGRYEFRQTYKGEPVFMSEYGGIRWNNAQMDKNDRYVSWGYGNSPRMEEEFKTRFKGLTDALLDNNRMFGLCYTQLTDVEQEQNGLYTYDRIPKFDPAWVRGIVSRKAAIED